MDGLESSAEPLSRNDARIVPLYDAARKSIEGARDSAAQIAVARSGELVAAGAFGSAICGGHLRHATAATLLTIFSCTKAITAAAAWILLHEGHLGLSTRVGEVLGELGPKPIGQVTVEQLLTHTAGFPSAEAERFAPDRVDSYARWEVEWEPGSRFVYHPTSSMWVLADIIARVAGIDYREFIRRRITEPLELDLYVGVPESEQTRVADVVRVGEPMTADERAVAPVDAPVVDDDTIAAANSRTSRMAGSPSGGAVATAASLAMFYQGALGDLAGNGPGIWDSAILEEATRVRNPGFVDPMTGHAAMRGLGVVVSGGDDRMWRGFPLECSPRAFGHMGAGGQVAWADPESGISFAYLTNAAQRNPVLQGATGFALSTLALEALSRRTT